MELAQPSSDWHMSKRRVSNNPHAERLVRTTPSECLEVPETAPTRRADQEELQAGASTLPLHEKATSVLLTARFTLVPREPRNKSSPSTYGSCPLRTIPPPHMLHRCIVYRISQSLPCVAVAPSVVQAPLLSLPAENGTFSRSERRLG